jgi:hypothetical protein
MRKYLLAAALLGALASPSYADVTLGGLQWTFAGADNLTLTPVVPGGNQPVNIQCVICGDHQPQQQADFGYTNFKNSGQPGQDLLYFSTNVPGGGDPGADTQGIAYSGDFLRAYLAANGDPNLTFSIGIDVNDTGDAQVLESFFLLNVTTKTVLSAYRGGETVLSQNNGTGFPDYTLGTFNIALGTDVHAGDQLAFFARLSNANDGPDSFFIVPQAVPGPVVGAGLPGLVAACFALWGFARNRRRRNDPVVA